MISSEECLGAQNLFIMEGKAKLVHPSSEQESFNEQSFDDTHT